MRLIYLARVVHGELVTLEPVLVPWERLDEERLEEVFRVSNFNADVMSLTGWPHGTGLHDYVIDPDSLEVWECLPVGWRRVRP